MVARGLLWLQAGSGCERFTLVLETNGILVRQLERKQAIILTIILQILTAKQTSARETPATIKGVSISMTTLICSCSHDCQ